MKKKKKVVASVSDIDEARLRLMCEKYDFTSTNPINVNGKSKLKK